MRFTKATRKKVKLRLGLTGPSGSGKTLGALMIAQGLGGRTAVIDTEHGSADLYAEKFDFDSMQLAPPYTPERFIQAIRQAVEAGYSNLIIDSITHEWSGSGGCLQINEDLAKAKYKGNTWSAWHETTPRHRAFLDAVLAAPLHIIATMRSKTETAQTEINGRKTVIKLGMKSEQRDGAEYEFTTVLDLVHDGHFALASKDRTGLFSGVDPKPISSETGKLLLNWLESGAEAVPVEPTANADTGEGQGMTEDELSDHLATIRDAFTRDDLQACYAIALDHAKRLNDAASAGKIKQECRVALKLIDVG